MQHRHQAQGGYFGVAWREHREAPWCQAMHPVETVAQVVEQTVRERTAADVYISQHTYVAGVRRTSRLKSLNLCHIDLDVYKTAYRHLSAERAAEAYVDMLHNAGLPAPSYIVGSGQGLQAKWLWNQPLTPRALPRWQAVHKRLIEHTSGELFGADAKAALPTQVMRVVGSRHQTSKAEVRVVWCDGSLHSPQRHDFDEFCTAVLPWTREQVRQFRARLAVYDSWDASNAANRSRALEEGLIPRTRSQAREDAWNRVASAIGVAPSAMSAMDDLVAGEIWQRRLDWMERLISMRYEAGVPAAAGLRHEYVWVAANAMAWTNRGEPRQTTADVEEWAKQYVPSYSGAEVRSAASSVLKRAREGGERRLYRMHEETWRAKLAITDGELTALTSMRHQRLENEGVMGFEPMSRLSYEEYRLETKRRQSEAADRTNRIRTERSEDARLAAVRLHQQRGLTTREIAALVGKSHTTVANWLRRNNALVAGEAP